jgi:GTPase
MTTTAAFRALIKRSFELTGRGTVVSVDVLEGVVTVGDRLALPMRDGTSRIVEVHAVDFVDLEIGRPSARAEIGLTFEDLVSDEVVIAGCVTAART